MLSYMVPVEEKSSQSRNLNLNLQTRACELPPSGNKIDTSTKKFVSNEFVANNIKSNCQQVYNNGVNEELCPNFEEHLGTEFTKSAKEKTKSNKSGTKNVTLKRVSFGSSKGSMVETLVFETPTPLIEQAEREFGYTPDVQPISTNTNCNRLYQTNNNNSSCLDDSGIEMQEELERAKVRVSFFQSSKPQQISPQDSYLHFSDKNLNSFTESFAIIESNMSSGQTGYDRQMSNDSGWDNPFRPDGDLSKEADEIVSMIKGGKPITPTCDAGFTIANGSSQNGMAVVDGAVKKDTSHLSAAQNGTKSPQLNAKKCNKASNDPAQVSNQVVPGPISASHVVIDEKKKKKCSCCVIQ